MRQKGTPKPQRVPHRRLAHELSPRKVDFWDDRWSGIGQWGGVGALEVGVKVSRDIRAPGVRVPGDVCTYVCMYDSYARIHVCKCPFICPRAKMYV